MIKINVDGSLKEAYARQARSGVPYLVNMLEPSEVDEEQE